MDVDAFVALKSSRWDRMSQLGRQRRLTGAEADELVSLYQASAGDLSQVRSAAPDPTLISRLSGMLGRTRGIVTGSHETSLAMLSRFFVISLPAAFYRIRWWTVAAMIIFLAVAAGYGWWLAHDVDLLNQLITPADRASYAHKAFESYYSDNPAPDFMAQVWTNNAWISAQMVGSGITGYLPMQILVSNASSIGTTAAVMHEQGMLGVFFALILPHGQMELTAIFIAWGAGTKVFWSMVRPGPRTRAQALAQEGRSLFTVALGLVVVLGLSGLVEGFVPRSGLPAGVQIAIGSVLLASYWTYTLVLGRRAARDGETGDVVAEHREATLAVVD